MLQLYYQNVRGLRSKTKEFFYNVSMLCYDFIALTETWLSEDISSLELFPSHYTVIRCDRNFGAMGVTRGGGVLLAYRNYFDALVLDLSLLSSALPAFDIVGCKFNFNNASVYIFVLYFPKTPCVNDLELVFQYLFEHYLHINKLLIVGDFNIPQFVANNLGDTLVSNINEYCNFLNLTQFNSILNDQGRLLDLVLSNYKCQCERCDLPLVNEDINYHPSINVNFDITYEENTIFPSNTDKPEYNFRRANFVGLYQALMEMDWSFLENYVDADEACNEFYGSLYKIFDKFVPYYKNKRKKHNYPSWFNTEIKHALKQKFHFFKKYRRTQLVCHLNKFRALRSKCKRLVHEAYLLHMEDVESSINQDSKHFWQFVNSRRNSTRIPGKMLVEGRIVESPHVIIESFADQFSGVFQPSGFFNGSDTIFSNRSCININEITDMDVSEAINRLKNKATSGPDNIPSFLIKDCRNVFSEPLRIIMNLCLKTSFFPTKWKLSRVCPVFKTGDLSDISNYRPISLASNFSKIFESVLYKHLSSATNYLSNQQHGFINRRSTITNLACFSQFICDCVDSNGQVDVVYTDFAKAFDRLDHGLLLTKLSKAGLSGSLIGLMHSYLSDRRFFVAYNGFASTERAASSGVPQGSILGPLLFSIFIDDILESINCQALLFADDLKIFSNVSRIEDCAAIQQNLHMVYKWSVSNMLPLNISKCHVMSFTRKVKPLHFNYMIENSQLKRSESVKDLGVVFDSRMTFTSHIEGTIASTSRMLGFVLRSCKHFSRSSTMMRLYFAFIRSKLEYAGLIWSPIYQNHKNSLENIQRRFLKYLWRTEFGHYPERGFPHEILLDTFGLTSLENRRNIQALKFLFDLVNNKITCPDLLHHLPICVPGRSTRFISTFYLPPARTNLRLRSPIFYMASTYNVICSQNDIFNCTQNELTNCYIRHLLE